MMRPCKLIDFEVLRADLKEALARRDPTGAHQLLSIATGSYVADTPGWYLHILAGPLSLALGLGWRWRPLFGLLAGYAVLFHALCWAGQLSLFSGCVYKPAPGRAADLRQMAGLDQA